MVDSNFMSTIIDQYLEEEKALQKCLAIVFVEQPVQGNLHNWIPDISASGRNEGRGGVGEGRCPNMRGTFLP